jgi:hypothetical protein
VARSGGFCWDRPIDGIRQFVSPLCLLLHSS